DAKRTATDEYRQEIEPHKSYRLLAGAPTSRAEERTRRSPHVLKLFDLNYSATSRPLRTSVPVRALSRLHSGIMRSTHSFMIFSIDRARTRDDRPGCLQSCAITGPAGGRCQGERVRTPCPKG